MLLSLRFLQIPKEVRNLHRRLVPAMVMKFDLVCKLQKQSSCIQTNKLNLAHWSSQVFRAIADEFYNDVAIGKIANECAHSLRTSQKIDLLQDKL
jgi:hypothetical protein